MTDTPQTEALNRAAEALTTPEDPLYTAIYSLLRNHRLTLSCCDDDHTAAYPLVDALSTEGPESTIASGEEEIRVIADELTYELRQKLAGLLVTHDLVNRFLSWPLPPNYAADPCATMRDYAYPRSGTNLLSADQAEAMLMHVLSPTT